MLKRKMYNITYCFSLNVKVNVEITKRVGRDVNQLKFINKAIINY